MIWCTACACWARAFGVEVEARYLASGKVLNEIYDEQRPVLSLADPGKTLPYPDDHFDLVVSFQVLEHVAELEPLVREVARVLRPGGRTVHVLPAKHRVREPHCGLPLVHWLPKNRVRKRAIAMLLAAGLGRKLLPGYGFRARVESIYAYANSQTFYRSPSRIAKAFSDAGLVPTGRRAVRALIQSRFPRLPFKAGLAGLMTVFRTIVVEAQKPEQSTS